MLKNEETDRHWNRIHPLTAAFSTANNLHIDSINKVHNVAIVKNPWTTKLVINNVTLIFKIDTGADVNVMP